ncbi:hypothetical protein H2202_011172 [Exophiala xenobiotica]|nr:hypothetical protein H2202_011172 [Exophiala xenobiotica]KAK5215252.1 hypothetical protein LTR72_011679 [Exophiala xenobiotica]KAK5284616.1 hypothetical protein LTR14_011624 [Exophiala xenobiotica]KAK5466237.1 hypothetical protein LTR55_011648 [Exophiala xenobiotica]
MPNFSSGQQLQEPSLRESGVFPIDWAVQKDRWQYFADEVVSDDAFGQLVVTLAHSIVAGSIRWNSAVLENIASPSLPQRDERLAALSTLQKIAKLPPSEPIANLQFTDEELQGFMHPILPPDHGLLQPTWLEGRQSLESTPIATIASELEKLGFPLDLEVLLARRRQLLAALHGHQIQAGPINLPMSMPLLREYSGLRNEVVVELGNSVRTAFMETILDIVVISRCEKLAPFLNVWSQSLEAESLISKVHAALHGESSHGDNMLPHSDNLLLLVAGYEIQRHFEPGVQTAQRPYLPSCLSQEGPGLYKNAALSYAQNYHREPTLGVFAPSLSSKPRAIQGFELWKDYWNQHFPSNWSPYKVPDVTFSSATSNQHLSMAKAKSHFHDDDGYTSGRSAILKFVTECFPFLK